MFNFLNKEDDEPIISFLPLAPGMIDVKEVMPQRSKAFIPSWWKTLPRKYLDDFGNDMVTAKACPSFGDYFSQGFILPAWADAELKYDKENDRWSALEAKSVSTDSYHQWTIHPNQQFLDHVDPMFRGQKPTMVFKGDSPWKIITKPGWSVMQLPLFYHFDNDLAAFPGIIDTDIEHSVNIQMLYFGNGKTVSIKRGQPLVQYIPFKRSDSVESFEIREPNKKDLKKISRSDYYNNTKFTGNNAYRKKQLERDQQ